MASRSKPEPRTPGPAQQPAPAGKTLRIKLVKSGIGTPERQKRTLKALGFRRLGQTIERPDNPAVRGMVTAVRHLVEVSES